MSEHLAEVSFPATYWKLVSRFNEGLHGESGNYHGDWVIGGFEDIIPEEFGTGLYYNTGTSTDQLTVALSVAQNPYILEAIESDIGSGSRKLIKTLRIHQVLSGFKLLDVGCGIYPAFAFAAKSLGAEVHTLDDGDLDPDDMPLELNSHTVIDAKLPGAVELVANVAGTDFDYVTANIIGHVPGRPFIQQPRDATLQVFGERLLTSGGHLFNVHHSLMQKL